MADTIYEVELPTGEIIEVEAPAGTSEDAIRQRVNAWRMEQAGVNPNEYNPADGMSGFDKFMAGVGRSVVETGRGIGQLTGLVSQDEVNESRRLDAPLLATGAGMTGNVVGGTAQMLAPFTGGARLASLAGRAAPYVGAATRGAAFSGAQTVAGDESRIGNSAIGGALGAGGQGVAQGAAALARGVAPTVREGTRQLAERARELGIRLGVGDLSENSMARTVTNQMGRLPFSGGAAVRDSNQDAFNRLVGKTFGANESRITPDVFAAAQKRVGDVFNDLSRRNSLNLSTRAVADLKAIEAKATQLAPTDIAKQVSGQIRELLSKADASGRIPGEAYKAFDSELGNVIRSGGQEANYLGQIRDVVRNAMDDSISTADQAAWREARRQWANMKTVEPLVGKSATGDISAAGLMGRVTADKAGKARMATGRGGELGELARIGQRFLKEPPNSGTPDRGLVNLIAAGGLGGLSAATPTGAAGIAAFLLANRLGNAALRSEALTYGGNPMLTGIARLLRPAPAALPALRSGMTSAEPLEIDITGGAPVSEEEARALLYRR